jgi:hypothetical protein
MDCEAFEGGCTCAEVAGADYCVSPCTWDGSKCDTPETTGPPQCNTYMDQTTCDGDMYCAWDVDGSACVDYVPPCSYDQSDPCNGDDACFWIEGDGTPAHPPHCAEHVHTGPAIDCSNVPNTAPCHVMELIDAVRDAASLSDIEPSVFCPCKRVRDNAPDANPETVASCNGGGP